MTSVPNLASFHLTYETPRLVLKTLTPENVSEDYIGWLQDREVLRYLEARHSLQTRETITKFVEDLFISDNNLMLGIFLKDQQRHIGNIKLGPINRRYSRTDIGIIVGDRNCWGRGYATEAIEGICRFAFDVLNLRRIQAGAYASNKGSIKAFMKAGFAQEAVLKNYWILEGKPEDDILLRRLAS